MRRASSIAVREGSPGFKERTAGVLTWAVVSSDGTADGVGETVASTGADATVSVAAGRTGLQPVAQVPTKISATTQCAIRGAARIQSPDRPVGSVHLLRADRAPIPDSMRQQ